MEFNLGMYNSFHMIKSNKLSRSCNKQTKKNYINLNLYINKTYIYSQYEPDKIWAFLIFEIQLSGYLNRCQGYDPDFSMKTLIGRELKCVQNYKYLGSFISDSVKDFKNRKGMAWTACNNLHNIWVSCLDDKIKINTFKTMIVPLLLYGLKPEP